MAADEDIYFDGWPTEREALTYKEARNVLDCSVVATTGSIDIDQRFSVGV
jgi:hypothetical protein